MYSPKLLPALCLTAALAFPGAAFADRAPTPEERAKIEAVLKKEGYTRWDSIELDDGYWEVDDAVGPDGRERDLRLDPKTFQIIRK